MAKALHPNRILVIDDSSEVRELVGFALEGYRVHYACDGREGLEMARAVEPDLVVLDIMMPNMDGLAFLKAASADPRLRYTKVLVLSARSLKEHIVEGFRLGAVDYVTKPFKADILRAKVDRLIQLRFSDEIRQFQDVVWRFINHHLRTPLTTINLCAQLVRECSPAAPAAAEWGPVIQATEQIADVLSKGTELVDLAAREPHFAAIDLAHVVEDVLAILAAEAEAAQVGFKVEDHVPPGAATAIGDGPYMARSLTLVVRKAIARSSQGTSVVVSTARSGADLLVSVRDNGTIPGEAELESLFRPYHVDWRAPSGPGFDLGLELPLAHLSAALSGGHLTGTANPDGGLEFKLTVMHATDQPVERPGGFNVSSSADGLTKSPEPHEAASG